MPRRTYELTGCPVCNSLDGLEIADRESMQSEVELLWSFHERRLRAGVPVQHLTDRVTFSQYPPLRLSQCRNCTHVYRNPRESREALEEAYREASIDDATQQALFDTQRVAYRAQVQRLTAVAGRPGTGLEVGSYLGGFLSAAREAGWNFEGIDVSESATHFAASKGFRVRQGEIGDFDAERALDVVAIWNTFEQLYDARSAVHTARRRLRPGGILVVRIPNGEFYVRWRALLRGRLSGISLRLLAHNNLLSFPYRQGFTERSLTTLLSACRFDVVKVFGDTLVPIADRWTTRFGAFEERLVKRAQRTFQSGWSAPWVELYARAAS
jgi:SAM-dependent methyltransferase